MIEESKFVESEDDSLEYNLDAKNIFGLTVCFFFAYLSYISMLYRKNFLSVHNT